MRSVEADRSRARRDEENGVKAAGSRTRPTTRPSAPSGARRLEMTHAATTMPRGPAAKLSALLRVLALCQLCAGDQWLMEGDFISKQDTLERNLHLETTNSTTSVSTSLLLTLSAPADHTINCVLAASLNMHGDVSVVEGGVGAENVTLAYKTRNGRPDFLFVMVESHVEKGLLLEMRDSVIRSSRIAILYDQMKDWKFDNLEAKDETTKT
ncbi:uncharacterized protein LOC131669783 [Phymastichus coffea]|uniref:uncharacterized protein LOC131669783 n=1 Tax=Phymastichus coffea TaxID=108790 RepID=UPI00273BF484|nr:uncharacterized protein LOC131669783 [Phymastichus coffea]